MIRIHKTSSKFVTKFYYIYIYIFIKNIMYLNFNIGFKQELERIEGLNWGHRDNFWKVRKDFWVEYKKCPLSFVLSSFEWGKI